MTVWRDIPNFPFYQASDDGKVRSLTRTVRGCYETTAVKRGRVLTPVPDRAGYLTVTVNRGGSLKTTRIHRLIALAFIPNPENKPQVNHRNGDKACNAIDNLEWATCRENNLHKFVVLGVKSVCGDQHGMAKLSEQSARDILISGERRDVLASKYGVNKSMISRIKTGKRWKHIFQQVQGISPRAAR